MSKIIMQVPIEIYSQIMQSALIQNTESFSSLLLTCTMFKELLNTNECIAAYYIGAYKESVYFKIMSCHPHHFIPSIISMVAQLNHQSIPNGVLFCYSNQTQTNSETMKYLKSQCNRIDDSESFLELFNAYANSIKTTQDRSSIIQALTNDIKKTHFIPAYTSATRIFYILEMLPVCLFEESKELALYLCLNSGLSNDEINTKMVAKIMWDYGYLKEWSNLNEKKSKVNQVMDIGGFKLEGRAVVDIIRRNTWVNWISDLSERLTKEEIETAVKIVIDEQLKRQSGGGYMVAQRLAKTYSIPSQFVDETYKKYVSFVL